MGEPVTLGRGLAEGVRIRPGRPPVVLQVQAHAYIPLDQPEQLKQWETDVRTYYGISVDASNLAGNACETCSYGCSDDCGLMEEVLE
jgi:hypothetical protein